MSVFGSLLDWKDQLLRFKSTTFTISATHTLCKDAVVSYRTSRTVAVIHRDATQHSAVSKPKRDGFAPGHVRLLEEITAHVVDAKNDVVVDLRICSEHDLYELIAHWHLKDVSLLVLLLPLYVESV